jgi:hypothetical protein
MMRVDDPLTGVENRLGGAGQPILANWYLVLVAAHCLLPFNDTKAGEACAGFQPRSSASPPQQADRPVHPDDIIENQ